MCISPVQTLPFALFFRDDVSIVPYPITFAITAIAVGQGLAPADNINRTNAFIYVIFFGTMWASFPTRIATADCEKGARCGVYSPFRQRRNTEKKRADCAFELRRRTEVLRAMKSAGCAVYSPFDNAEIRKRNEQIVLLNCDGVQGYSEQ